MAVFYILIGELTLQVGVHTVTAKPGAYVFVPRGIIHTFSNPGAVSELSQEGRSWASKRGVWALHDRTTAPPSQVVAAKGH
jgi:mannose-6-phosphate isomerase-like protein (cupin superfamily)